ncbi:MAG: SurA N-terminal domain-containing protein [Nitrospirae bacterium]|nr:SurA N-terminal domain-containing protein [Nitrospirota bacterium]
MAKTAVRKSIVFLFLILFFVNPILRIEAKIIERVAAVVNNRIITLSALNTAIEMNKVKGGGGLLDEKTMLEKALWGLIDRGLLINEAERFGMAKASDAEIGEAVNKIRNLYPTASEFEGLLSAIGIDMEGLQLYLSEEIITNRFIDQRIRFFVRISDADIKRFYNENLSRFNDKTIEEAKGEIEALLTEMEAEKKLDEYIKKLRSKAEIKVNIQY